MTQASKTAPQTVAEALALSRQRGEIIGAEVVNIRADTSYKARRALRKWGIEACRTAWHYNELRGEGTTVCSYASGIPLRSVDSAINAYREIWKAQFSESKAEPIGGLRIGEVVA